MGSSNFTVSVSEAYQFHHPLQTLHTHLHQSLQRHALSRLLDPHPLALLQRVEQIDQFLVVNLQNRTRQLLPSLTPEHLLQRTRNYAEQLTVPQLPEHCEGFARTRLPVGKDR